MADLPFYLWVLVLAAVVGIPALTAAGLFVGTAEGGGNRRRAVILAGSFASVWTAWLIVSWILTDGGAYRQSAVQNRPWIGVAAGAVLLSVLVGTRIPAVRRALNSPGMPARLALPHVFRVGGVTFLIAMALGRLPAVFALPAGLGDLAVGLSAPFVARRLARGDRTGAVWFNVLGLVDLIVAVSLGFLAGLGPLRLLDVTPSTIDVTLLPLALIPSTAVPLAMALHVTSLIRLRTAAVPAGRRSGQILQVAESSGVGDQGVRGAA